MQQKTQLPFTLWGSLPSHLRDAAYRSEGEVAWLRQDALLVVEFLHKQGYGVLGVDIWIPTLPGPTIPNAVYDLDSSRLSSESWNEYVERSHGQAVKFISEFEFDGDVKETYKDISPVFNVWAVGQNEE